MTTEKIPEPLKKGKRYWQGLKVVKDPIPTEEGGLRPGHHLPELEVKGMMDVFSFAEGTILEDRNGKRYVFLSSEL